MERLDKIISNLNILSRSDAKKAIRKGLFKVDGIVIKDSDYKVMESSIIEYDSKTYEVSSKPLYIMLYKPLGVVSSTDDPKDKTVIDILPSEFKRKDLFPCGRLDKETTGLLIITNDGVSAHKRLSKTNHTEKEYEFVLAEDFNEKSISKLENGITLRDGLLTKPCKLNMKTKRTGSIILKEGKYHEIRRMFAYFSNLVVELKRVRFGSIVLDPSLQPGEARLLTEEEIKNFTE